jgi:hypothetical protein
MKHTAGPWLIATSNSWRRIVSRDYNSVCEPITQNDGHPDLYFRNGGADGPDARLIALAPVMWQALVDAAIDLRGHRKSRMDIASNIERVLAELERSDECTTTQK